MQQYHHRFNCTPTCHNGLFEQSATLVSTDNELPEGSVTTSKHNGACEVREKTNKMHQLDVYYQYFLNMFRASLCPSSGEQDMCYCTWCAVLILLDVVSSGCGALCCRVRAL